MGNFSRNTFDKLKHYVGVRLQQGVPLVDADWNEQEDIRKYELQAFLKWFVGNGIPKNNEGFRILAASGTSNDFDISGGDGTTEGAGRCIVEGWDVINESNLRYSSQPLYNNAALAAQWGVDPLIPLTTPVADRVDTVYLDVWEREVDGTEDSDLINPAIGIETCVRLKREWVVRVAEGTSILPTLPSDHFFYKLASLKRPAENAVINKENITDLRTTCLNLADLTEEISDARGIKGNLGNRLDESLTRGGQLRHNVVGNEQLNHELSNRVGNIENHLSRVDNPHSVTAAQTGALEAADYDFANGVYVNVVFTHSDSNNATRTVITGFRSRFVWIVGSARARLGSQFFGANVSGYADLRRSPFIQQCTGTEISKIAVDDWRQDTSVNQFLCKAKFTDETSVPQRSEDLNVSVSDVSDSGLTVRLSRIQPGTAGTAGTTGGTSPLTNFRIELRLLCVG
ncbi:MAG: hypothetical protein IMF11_09270 [Proteobacteria bacterium]|jgi:hypothetical protein|nr:hypothetical protein [Pseudomonadota bacterium]